MPEKKCTRCNIIKPFGLFSKASREKDGLQYHCKQCNKEQSAKHRAENPEKERQRHAAYHSGNKVAVNFRISQWQKDNPEKVREKSRRFYWNNLERERKRQKKWGDQNRDMKCEVTRQWRLANIEYRRQYEARYLQQNKGKIYAKMAKRRSLKKNAIAIWANVKKIQTIYAESVRLTKETGIEYHVDHVIPLVSKFVCGLHCEDNLQILTASENSTKCNRFKPYSY